MTTTTTKQRTANASQPTRAGSAGAPPPPAPTTPAPNDEPLDELALDAVKDSAATVADTFLMTTGLRPLYETQKTVWQGAARVWDGEPIADVVADSVVPRQVRDLAAYLGGIDTMKPGDELSTSVEVTAAIEGIAGRRQVEVSIEKSEHGFLVALDDAGAVGFLAGEHGVIANAEAGVFERVGAGLAVEVATADEAKTMALLMAASGNTSVGALGEAALLAHPGLREVELSAGLVTEAEVALPSSDELAELGLEGSAGVTTSAKFVAGSAPELVISCALELEDAAEVALAFGGADIGTGATAEGKATKEARFALPPGSTLADLPGLLARGEVFSQVPRVQWQLEASVRGLDGKTLAIEGTVEAGKHGHVVTEGAVEWRSAPRRSVGAGELEHSSGATGRSVVERSSLLRREEVSSVKELERALRSVRGEMTRAP